MPHYDRRAGGLRLPGRMGLGRRRGAETAGFPGTFYLGTTTHPIAIDSAQPGPRSGGLGGWAGRVG